MRNLISQFCGFLRSGPKKENLLHFGEVVFQNQHLRIAARDRVSAEGGRILLSFTGIGHAMGGVDVQKNEFFGAGRQFSNVIFITDLERSWGNNIDFDKVSETLADIIGDRPVFAIGNSMGGFLSIVCSAFIDMEVVIAFVPQFSVSKRILPEEVRWDQYVNRIKDFKFETLEPFFQGKTDYYLFSGDASDERRHWEKFPSAPNIHNIVLKSQSHYVAEFLKSSGMLTDVIERAFDRNFDPISASDPAAGVIFERIK